MNFDMGEAEKQVIQKIRELLTGDAAAELTGIEPLATKGVREILRRWFMALAETGYLDSSAEGGRNSVSVVAIQEQLASLAPSLFLSVEASVRIFGRVVSRFGTNDQKNAVLPDLLRGKTIGALALSENTVNIENDPLFTTGVSFGDGFLLTGLKNHVVNAPIADWIAVAGKIDGQENPALFLMEKGQEGLFIGDRLATLGYEGAPISSIEINKCPVSATRVIHPGQDIDLLKALRMWEDQVLTAASLGLMRRSFDAALIHAKTHQSGGKPIIAYQEIGFKLAEMLTLFQTAQLLAYRAAWMSESNDREADVLAHAAKIFCAESAEKVASNALQILGGKGYVRGNPVETGYRNAKYGQIFGTSTEISRMKIADRILGF